MIASPYSTFAANRGQGFAIGTRYEITHPAPLPDQLNAEIKTTRRALACPWSPPKKPAPVADLFAAMFGDSQA